MGVTIRSAQASDVPAITAIYAEAVETSTVSFETAAPGADEMARRLAELRAGGFPYRVAVRDGHVVGYAYAGPYHRRAAYRSTVEDSIYLHTSARGQGIGRALLADLIAACERIDSRTMVAIIVDGGSPASVALHAALGFARAGTLVGVGHKHGRWLDTILMQRALGPGLRAPPTRT